MRSEESAPVAIVGGGPVGMSLGLALQKLGVAAEIFDARERGAGLGDRRILALSHGTQQTMAWLGAWQGIDATPIETIHVSQRGRAGRTIIRASDEGVPALGHVVSMHELYKTLDAAVTRAGIAYHDNARVSAVAPDADRATFTAGDAQSSAQLVAYAEGVVDDKARIRRRDYQQHALTALVTVEGAAPRTAWERFTPEGPLALLPFGQAYALVQTCTPERAAELAKMPAAEFLAQLQQRFGSRLRFVGAAGPRHSFALGLRYRRTAIAERQVWLGNAAQTLHPVAGQGFNLALRDVRALAHRIASVKDCGSADVLQAYARERRIDRHSVIGFTDTLVRLFSNDVALLGHLRGAGLTALDLLPTARSLIARRMMFGARAWP